MKSRLLAALFAFASLTVIGCDPLGGSGAQENQKDMVQGSTFDPTAPGNRVEPARFGKPGPAPADSASRQLASASFSPVSAVGAAGPEGDAFKAASVFDGARGGQLTPVSFATAGQPARTHGALVFADRKMAIDTDGRIASRASFNAVAARDKWRRDKTSLKYSDGTSLDPTVVPFIVIPNGFQGAHLGDLAYVTYKGRGAWAIVGDYGPTGHFGEASSALAAKLGINPDGRVGGVESGVDYMIFPGSGAGRHSNQGALTDFVRVRSAELAAPPSGPRTVSI